MVRNSNRFLDVTTAATATNGSYSSSLVEYSRTLSTISPLTLSPPVQPVYREEPTRVQLQRQRLKEQHANASRIPGFKTSAGEVVQTEPTPSTSSALYPYSDDLVFSV